MEESILDDMLTYNIPTLPMNTETIINILAD